jgi:hypothetical protein
MIFGNTVKDTRALFFTTWEKHQERQPLSPLEQQILSVILDHPEFHQILASASRDAQYFPELGQVNPFLHMGLHIALREQVSTNRPVGITHIFQQLVEKTTYPIEAEHQMIDCLAESLWQAQRNQTAPDEISYLEQCKLLLKK